MFPIRLIDANDQLLEAELEDRTYYLGMSWNEEGQLWTLSVRDLNKQVLISGIAVVPNFRLLKQLRSPALPPGDFAVDAPQDMALGRDAFTSGRAVLYYIEAGDFEDAAL